MKTRQATKKRTRRAVWFLERNSDLELAARSPRIAEKMRKPVTKQTSQSAKSSWIETFKPPASISIASSDGFALPRSMRLM